MNLPTRSISNGELQTAYRELRRVAARYVRREGPGYSLTPTDLVHEAFLRLRQSNTVEYQDTTHLRRLLARAMRQVLVDRARQRKAVKRGRGWVRVSLNETIEGSSPPSIDILSLHEALEKLERLNVRQAQILESRYFGGYSVEETAEILGISERTVVGDSRVAHAWLHRELTD